MQIHVNGNMALGAVVVFPCSVLVMTALNLYLLRLAVVKMLEHKPETLLAIRVPALGRLVLGNLAVLECVRVMVLNL